MTSITAADAQDKLSALVEQTATEHKPLLITGRNSSAVLVAEEDWRGLQETLYLLSVPGMRDKLEEGLRTDIKDCSTDPGW